MNKEDVAAWLGRYIEAWKSNDPRAIGDIFTEDATYQYKPWEEPTRGREAIVNDWLAQPDPPDSWSAHYEPFAVDGDAAVSVGKTLFFGPDRSTVVREYHNVWLLRFDDSGRCKEFSEFYLQAPTKNC